MEFIGYINAVRFSQTLWLK